MKRVPLFTLGHRPSTVHGYSVVLPSGRKLVRVEWREHGKRKTKSWADTGEGRRLARATGNGIRQRLENRGAAAPERVRVGELFEKYVLANEAQWRSNTLKNARNNWRLFQETVSPSTYADLITQETLDEVRAALRGRKIVANSIRSCITRVKSVWAWARKRRLVAENVLADYGNSLPKDGQPLDIPEYTPSDVAALMGVLSYRNKRAWRVWCAVQIASLLGPRQNAMLSLEWRDVSLTKRTVRWRPETDKLGREREQPLPRAAVFAFRVAAVWRRRMAHAGRFVFPPVQGRRGDRPWTYAALSEQLKAAEARAGIQHMAYRGMHGFRRGAAKNVLALTGGDLNKAGEWIGDRDLRTLKRSYLKSRPEELRSVADLMQMPSGLPRNHSNSNPTATADANLRNTDLQEAANQ